jgi:hypothetical protein
VIGRAGGGKVELLGGDVAGAEAPLDFGGGSEQRQVPGAGPINYLLERGGNGRPVDGDPHRVQGRDGLDRPGQPVKELAASAYVHGCHPPGAKSMSM